MYSNLYWRLFLGLMIIVIIGYTGYASVKVWHYIRLDQQTAPQTMEWSVTTLNDDAFVPHATYQFRTKGKIYEGQDLWPITYLNEWAAQEAIEKIKQTPQTIWFDSDSPTYSALQRSFPFKASIYTIILWLLGLYFLGLGYYVKYRS